MAILKLANEGDTATLHVKSCSSVKGTYGWQVKFESFDGQTLFMPLDSANRQLLRCGFDSGTNDEEGEPAVAYEAVEGNHLTFSRTKNPKPGSKPYWNVDVASGEEKHPKPASKRIQSPADTRTAGQREIDAAVPEDGPPAHHHDSGVPDSPEPIVEAVESTPDAKDAKRAVVVDAYLALYDYMAAELVKCGRAHDFPVDSIGVNAAVATLWITLKDRGLA